MIVASIDERVPSNAAPASAVTRFRWRWYRGDSPSRTAANAYGRVEVQFEFIRRKPPFDELELGRELQAKLNAIVGVVIADDALDKRPSTPSTRSRPTATWAPSDTRWSGRFAGEGA